jgi:Transposase DDE domain
MYPPLVGRARPYLSVWGLGAVLECLERFLDEPQLRAGLIKPAAFVRPTRLYALRVTMKRFLTPCLSQDPSCRTAVATAQERGWLPPSASPDTAAYCRAREALAAGGLSHALVQTGEALDARGSPAHLWLGRRVRVIDGTGIALPATPAHQADSPQPAEQTPGGGCPVLRLVAWMSLATGAVIQDALSALHAPAQRLFHDRRPFLTPGEGGLGERHCGTCANLVLLQRHGVDAVFRQPHARTAHGPPRTRLGTDDDRVQWHPRPGYRPPGLAPAVALPKTMSVREGTGQVTQPGLRTHTVTLVTTLMEARRSSAKALALLYCRRWAMERWLRDSKTTLGRAMLRTKTPSRVQAEVAMCLWGYTLIRAVRHDAAQLTHAALSRVRFSSTWVRVRLWCARCARPETLRTWLMDYPLLWHNLARDVNPHRPGRVEPRVITRRPKPFPRMQQPRRILRDALLRL